jgi:ribosomal protein S18 acetylase RimI-like enzyme
MSVRYHPVPHADAALARRIERAEIEFCAAAGSVGARGGVASLEAGGGLALYGVAGSPLNKVLGLGVGVSVSDADLDAIEAFYARHRSPAQIELCPLAGADVGRRLSLRGFVLQAFENELARPLSPDEAHAVPSAPARGDLRVDETPPGDTTLWVNVVADAFAAAEQATAPAPESSEQLRAVMSQFAHPSITRYLVRVGGEPAGGGAAFVHDGVAGIFGTATLPRFRRQGVQAALVAASLADVARRADLAIATVDPGSPSQRTFERLGFRVVYTRAILLRDAV